MSSGSGEQAKATAVVALVGCGRLGHYHVQNFVRHANVRVKYVCDKVPAACDRLLRDWPDLQHRHACQAVHQLDCILNDEEVRGVIICSPSEQHEQQIEAALAAGKHVLTEKPVTLTATATAKCFKLAKQNNLYLFSAFTRRWDPHFGAAIEAVGGGEVGQVQLTRANLRDPHLPAPEFLRNAGNLFLDCMIHDIDSALAVVKDTPKTVFATAHSHYEQVAAAGDWDTITMTLQFVGGAVSFVDVSRFAAYGYDNRLEVFGSKGMLSVATPLENEVTLNNASGVHRARWMHRSGSYLHRHNAAFAREDCHFIDFLLGKTAPVDYEADCVMGVRIAEACLQSALTGQAVNL